MYSIENKDPPRKKLHTKLNFCSLNINLVVWFMLSFLFSVQMLLTLLSHHVMFITSAKTPN